MLENSFAHRARALYLSYEGNISIFSHICSAYVGVQLGNIIDFGSDPGRKFR